MAEADSDHVEAFDKLTDVLDKLSENPYDIALHAQHLQLVSSMDAELQATARQMFTSFWPATDDIWLPVIEERIAKGVDSEEDVMEVIGLFQRAEADYLSIPILQKHAELLIDRHAFVLSAEMPPDGLRELFSTETTRALLQDIAQRASTRHWTQGHLVWDLYYQWELEQIEKTPDSERPFVISDLEDFILDRLKMPHSTHEQTFQLYSSFTTTFKPPEIYESLLVSASKSKALAVKAYERRDMNETYLAQAQFSPEAWDYYINSEIRRERAKERERAKDSKGRRKNDLSDPSILRGLYERAIADTAKRRFTDISLSEMALRKFWTGYLNHLRWNEEFPAEDLKSAFDLASRSVPGCGYVWGRYFFFLEATDEDQSTMLANVNGLYDNALTKGLVQKEVDSLAVFVSARASLLRRAISSGDDLDSDMLTQLFELVHNGVMLTYQVSAQGDSRFRLEKMLAKLYTDLLESPEKASEVWLKAAEHVGTSYLAWLNYIDALLVEGNVSAVRETFLRLVGQRLDWPEMIFDAWTSFEHLHGSLEELQTCLDRVEREQAGVNMRRAKEAEKAAQSQAVYQTEQMDNASTLISEAVAESSAIRTQNGGDTAEMDIDQPSFDPTKKRKLENDGDHASTKKAKPDAQKPVRDRENSTVFVSELPASVTEEKLRQLFKDCGPIHEIKISELPNSHVATIEFQDRNDVPSALTKDKKRVDNREIAVTLAWQSTLFVTNFPEGTDEASVRQLFGQFGVIFDTRWPSKKANAKRRFCYIQYTSPDAAKAALSLNGKELAEGFPMTVAISNPERKKTRTDAGLSEREICIRGLSKFVTEDDLAKLFKQYGAVKEVRIVKDEKDQRKGLAFVEFEDEASARSSLAANNYDLKNRRISVTLSDPRVRAKQRNEPTESGFSRAKELRNRSVRICGLPSGTQEGLLQQLLEKVISVKRVEVFQDIGEATVELKSAADAGKLLLKGDSIEYNGHKLQIREELPEGVVKKAAKKEEASSTMFVPRGARPRAGIGSSKKIPKMSETPMAAIPDPPKIGKSQDDFRKLL